MGMSKPDKIQWAWDNNRTHFDFGENDVFCLPAPKELPAGGVLSEPSEPLSPVKCEIIEYRLGHVTEHAGQRCREIIGSFGETHRVVSYWLLP